MPPCATRASCREAMSIARFQRETGHSADVVRQNIDRANPVVRISIARRNPSRRFSRRDARRIVCSQFSNEKCAWRDRQSAAARSLACRTCARGRLDRPLAGHASLGGPGDAFPFLQVARSGRRAHGCNFHPRRDPPVRRFLGGDAAEWLVESCARRRARSRRRRSEPGDGFSSRRTAQAAMTRRVRRA
jgi:hypothetical protein